MRFPGQALRFGCVGAGASAVHLGVVSALVPLGLPPLIANVVAFAAAFQVSYYGHRSLTFRAAGSLGSYGKMLSVSLLAFAANEAMYSALLKFTTLDYRVALALVLASVAAVTFLAARCWVFRPHPETTRASSPPEHRRRPTSRGPRRSFAERRSVRARHCDSASASSPAWKRKQGDRR